MAQLQVYRTLTPKAKAYKSPKETMTNTGGCLGEGERLVLSGQEYDGIVALGESERRPSEALKWGMEMLRQHGL